MALLCMINNAYGQQAITLHSNGWGRMHEIALIDSGWLFHAGELPGKNPSLTNTTAWKPIAGTSFGETNAPAGWAGIGWFGLWVKVDPDLVNKKLSLRINHDAASEIFIDGRPVGGYGKLGHSAQEMKAIRAPLELIPIWLPDTKPHLIAVHFANYVGTYPNFWGFQVSIGDYEQRAPKINRTKTLFGYVAVFTAAQLTLGLLHFLLFLFYPKQRLNMYYALFVLIIGINGAAIYFFYQTSYPPVQYIAEFITTQCRALIMWAGITLLYVLNYGRVPRWRRITLAAVSVFYIVEYTVKFLFFPVAPWADYFAIAYFICVLDGGWSAFQLVKKRQKGIWMIGIGVMVVLLLYFFAWGDVFGLWPNYLNSVRVFVFSAGELILPLFLSIYLGLDFARTNQKLAAKLIEVEKLSADALAQEAEKRRLIVDEARRLEEIVQQRTAELKEQADKLLELDNVKSRFFTNITHEFKTPLTLIINPAKELLYNPTGDSNKNLRLIISNAERLLQLINQLLDLSKVESGMMDVNLAPVDLVALLKLHTLSYESLALQKDIGLHFTSSYNSLWVMADKDKMDKVILNVLSNALKFTDKGNVEVNLEKDAEAGRGTFTITVRDTGKGIPAQKLPYIFSRFYQADPSDTRLAGGTGIGLALTKELVELLGGRIRLESVEGLFTHVSIHIPWQVAEATNQPTVKTLADSSFILTAGTGKVFVADEASPLILLIEDHDELREFIRQSLASQYRLITAADGEEGMAFARQHIPNLIITDLMMPKVSGYEVSETLKRDEKTSHIPIIILTAKSGLDSRIQGIETGADAYLAKPFDQRELLAIIENLISTREQLRLHYSTRNLWLNHTVALPSIEQDFITRIRLAVERHLNEEGYSADQLAADMGLSRTQLHRKLKGLIGQAPGELIRIVRLQYAHNLLERRVATVSEVAYMVGFGSPASFSSSFSRHFGFPPSKVMEA